MLCERDYECYICVIAERTDVKRIAVHSVCIFLKVSHQMVSGQMTKEGETVCACEARKNDKLWETECLCAWAYAKRGSARVKCDAANPNLSGFHVCLTIRKKIR